MEHLLHYTWQHKAFPLRPLLTTDGQSVEVLNSGMHNTDAGPDFIAASVKIGGTLWVGNVEIHLRSSDWFRHHHDDNRDYDNVILHVATVIDCPILYPDGTEIPQLQLDVPPYVKENYSTLIHRDVLPRCKEVLASLPILDIHQWMSALSLQRLAERKDQIMARRESLDKNWEDTLFVTVARNFGFGINGDAFELWAHSIPMGAVAKHRDDLFQVEAIFFGQAGLLEGTFHDDYPLALQREYRYLRQKFSLTPIPVQKWKFLRLRPQNFPHIRISQLAVLYYEQRLTLARLVNSVDTPSMQQLLLTRPTDYWHTHYTFDASPSRSSDKTLSLSSQRLIMINSVAPMLFAYGSYKSDDALCQRAQCVWESLPPESNSIIRRWAEAGVTCFNASDSQALIQLTRRYCQPRDCLRCRFGSEFISRTPDLLREGKETDEEGE